MYSLLFNKLQKHYEENGPINLGIAGTGYIGGGLLAQLSRMKEPYYRPMVILYHSKESFLKAIERCEPVFAYEFCTTEAEVKKTLSKGAIAAVTQIELMFTAPIDVVLDMTGVAPVGAEIAYKAIMNQIPVMASPETDICVGLQLSRIAKRRSVVYSGFSGDEPGEIMNLVSYVKLMNFDIVAAGKFKNFHDPYATPASVKKWADLYGQNPYKLASFADGTKMNMEMGIVANATGLIPDINGMHCPEGTLETVADLMRPISQGGILEKEGVVEVVRGVEPTGGVFVVGRSDYERTAIDLAYLKMGAGPNYLFYKPYHLCQFEMLLGVAKVVLMKDAVVQPLDYKVAEIVPFAKKTLDAGERVDQIGGYAFYGLIHEWSRLDSEAFISASLLPGATITRKVKQDEMITLKDIEVERNDYMWQLLDGRL
jgi:predicted homoserine dehydrogenase-like protein